MDGTNRCPLCVSVYVQGTALIVPFHIWHRDGAVVSEHSFQRFFQTPELRMDSYVAPSFSCIYRLNRRGCGVYRQRLLKSIWVIM
jgi:hypothetical protein